MYRLLISVLETILDKFHYSTLKNEHFFVVKKSITSHQRGKLGKCALGVFPWMIVFKWHQACISSTIIPRGVAIWNIENLTFRKMPSKVRKWLYSHNVSFYNLIVIKRVWIERFLFWKQFWIENVLLQEMGTETESWKKKWFNLNPLPLKQLPVQMWCFFQCEAVRKKMAGCCTNETAHSSSSIPNQALIVGFFYQRRPFVRIYMPLCSVKNNSPHKLNKHIN